MLRKHPFNQLEQYILIMLITKRRMALSSSSLKSVVCAAVTAAEKGNVKLMVHSQGCKSSECLNWLALLYFLNPEWPTVLIATVCALLKNSNKHQYHLPPVFDAKEFIKINKLIKNANMLLYYKLQ